MAPTKKYFRNKTYLHGIDPGSLWQLTPKGYVLVDDDQHIIVPITKSKHFIPV